MKVLLIDDHPLCRSGTRFMLTGLFPDAEVFEASNGSEARTVIDEHPDLNLCLVDLSLPGESGLTLIQEFARRFPGIACIVISANEDTETILATMRAGARGYIPKTMSESITEKAIHLVLAGDRYLPAHLLHIQVPQQAIETAAPFPNETLTPRQMAVLKCLMQGLPTKSIARKLSLSDNTVKTHLAAIYRALNVNTRSQAVIAASRSGLLPILAQHEIGAVEAVE